MTRFPVILTALFFLALSALITEKSAAQSFHNGGPGYCGGCHFQHGSEDGFSTGGSISPLLRASDPGSVCLRCHAGPGTPATPSVFSPDGSALTPGGDFYWITRNFTWSGGRSPAERHGHNVVALDFNLLADPNRIKSPGGGFPSARLTCISCHDPHKGGLGGTRNGKGPSAGSGSYGAVAGAVNSVGNYRLLGGAGYTVDGFTFTEDAPVARQSANAPFGETDASHVDYGSGMSEWCGNCHGQVLRSNHQVGGSGIKHPAGSTAKFDTEIVADYNAYIRTGEMTGTSATAYLQFVPFERGTSDAGRLDPGGTRGPDVNANVMCLTCHRAHASAFPHAGRWDFSAGLLRDSHPALGDSGVTSSDIANSYYGRDIVLEFGTEQKSFCEKCHAGDSQSILNP